MVSKNLRPSALVCLIKFLKLVTFETGYFLFKKVLTCDVIIVVKIFWSVITVRWRLIVSVRYDEPQRSISSRVAELSVASGSVYNQQSDQNTKQKEHQHGILHKFDVLRMKAGVNSVPSAKCVIMVDKF